jgi:ferredoxin/DMSO/TMAO reductase YedYZ heme-binding membrane subunit
LVASAERRIIHVVNATLGVHLIAATVGSLSFLLIWLAVMLGLVLRNGWLLTRVKHSALQGTHQMVALLGLLLAVVHAFAQVAVFDSPVHLIDTVVPFANSLDPYGIGVGVVSLELMVATSLSVLIQRKLGYSRWRALHTVTYGAFLLMAAHVLMSGSDSGYAWLWAPTLASVVIVVFTWVVSTTWLAFARRKLRRTSGVAARAANMTVNVDAARCARFGFCEQAAPQVFKLRSDGRLSYRASVSDEEIGAVINAAEVCPLRAITLGRVPTSVLTPPPPPEPVESFDPPDLPRPLVEHDELGARRRAGTVNSMRRHRGAR